MYIISDKVMQTLLLLRHMDNSVLGQVIREPLVTGLGVGLGLETDDQPLQYKFFSFLLNYFQLTPPLQHPQLFPSLLQTLYLDLLLHLLSNPALVPSSLVF